MQNNSFNSFLNLPLGVRRIFIAGSIFPIIYGIVIAYDFIFAIITPIIAYWMAVFISVWVYNGFKKDNIYSFKKEHFEQLSDYLHNELNIKTQDVKDEMSIYEAYLERELTLKEKKEFLDAIIQKRLLVNANKYKIK